MKGFRWAACFACAAALAACSKGSDGGSSCNTCPSSGATQCSGPQVQTCVAGGDGCLVWSEPAPCTANLACDAVQNACVDRLVTISWTANRESGVNEAGGGYRISITGGPTLEVPYVSGPAAPTSKDVYLAPGTHTVTVKAYAALDADGGSTGTESGASQPITVTVNP